MVMNSPMDEHLRGAWNHMKTIGNPCISCSAALSGLGTVRMPPDLALVDYNYLEMFKNYWEFNNSGTPAPYFFYHMTRPPLIFSGTGLA